MLLWCISPDALCTAVQALRELVRAFMCAADFRIGEVSMSPCGDVLATVKRHVTASLARFCFTGQVRTPAAA